MISQIDKDRNALILLSDGNYFVANAIGSSGFHFGEICFNTGSSGYQEIITDPSYTGQFILFTFPHIGNVGCNNQDIEFFQPAKKNNKDFGSKLVIMRELPTNASNYRSQSDFINYCQQNDIAIIHNLDTRSLTRHISINGVMNACIFIGEISNVKEQLKTLEKKLQEYKGIENCDIASLVSIKEKMIIDLKSDDIYINVDNLEKDKNSNNKLNDQDKKRIIIIDLGCKLNIIRIMNDLGCEVILVPVTISSSELDELNADGIILSNGPGDPKATYKNHKGLFDHILSKNIPILAICLGHQILGLAKGANTIKMHQGHHGINHPIYDKETNKVFITSMNHSFALDKDSFANNVKDSQYSLFDNSNCSIEIGENILSLQYHPEASPGPNETKVIFTKFLSKINENAKSNSKNNVKKPVFMNYFKNSDIEPIIKDYAKKN